MSKNLIVILLSTYNGEKYLKEQLDSLLSQSHKDFKLIVRDDGSIDKTLEIFKSYNIELLSLCENLGVKKSFETLLMYAYENSDAKYFMFCDQDDVWKNDKIEKTLIKMKQTEEKYEFKPTLIHTDLVVVDDKLGIISNSMWKYESILPQYNSFSRLLIQNTITGCTVMINRKLASKSLCIPTSAVMHDWWIGLIASEFGVISYLEESTILYRQHSNNTIGAKNREQINFIKSFLSICFNLIKRDRKYIKDFEANIDQARVFLEEFKFLLDQNTKDMIENFINIDKSNFFAKRIIVFKYKLFKQNVIDNISLLIKL